MDIASVGIDLGKTTFHLVALNGKGKVLIRKKFSRTQLLAYTANLHHSQQPPLAVVRRTIHSRSVCASPDARSPEYQHHSLRPRGTETEFPRKITSAALAIADPVRGTRHFGALNNASPDWLASNSLNTKPCQLLGCNQLPQSISKEKAGDVLQHVRSYRFSGDQSSDIRGASVYGTNDEKLGRIDDVIFESARGEIRYVVIDI